MKVYVLLIAASLMPCFDAYGQENATCERVKVQAMGWFVMTNHALSPDTIRQREEQVFVTKDLQEIEGIMSRLRKQMAEGAAAETALNLDARLVVDCFKRDGHVESYVASLHELRHPPGKKPVVVDEKFRRFFTIDKDFGKRLKS